MIFLQRRKEGFRDGCIAGCSWVPGALAKQIFTTGLAGWMHKVF